ncbi:HNH endonuclease [Aquamicrobium soli]|uniref:HNH endonuclease n=1 Tax=Aquamicrobium soli TaxID=1811518 RepID=A0ABV7KHT3_9HYPH
MTWGFIKGQTYRLDSMVERFGGNKQSGIIPSVREPVVLLIDQPKSKKVYKNRWRDDGIFEMYAQGRIGPQTWTSNNKAVRDHFADGRALLVFQTDGKKKSFLGEFMLIGIQDRMDYDESAPPQLRSVFVFELQPVESSTPEYPIEEGESGAGLDDLRKRAYEAAETMKDPRNGTRTIYYRSVDVHRYVLARADGRCESSVCRKAGPFISKSSNLPYLEAHHTIRRCDAGPDSPRYVIAICPNCHRRVHFGADGIQYNKGLIADAEAIEEKLGDR